MSSALAGFYHGFKISKSALNLSLIVGINLSGAHI